MFGVSITKSCGRWMPADSISCALNALTATGTSWRDSSRLRAVTTTSSRVSCDWDHTGTGAVTAAQIDAAIQAGIVLVVMCTPPGVEITRCTREQKLTNSPIEIHFAERTGARLGLAYQSAGPESTPLQIRSAKREKSGG